MKVKNSQVETTKFQARIRADKTTGMKKRVSTSVLAIRLLIIQTSETLKKKAVAVLPPAALHRVTAPAVMAVL